MVSNSLYGRNVLPSSSSKAMHLSGQLPILSRLQAQGAGRMSAHAHATMLCMHGCCGLQVP